MAELNNLEHENFNRIVNSNLAKCTNNNELLYTKPLIIQNLQLKNNLLFNSNEKQQQSFLIDNKNSKSFN